MKNFATLILLAVSILLSACATTRMPRKIYKGSYFYNFESSSFTATGSDESWCVNSAEMAKARVPSSSSGTADVVVLGKLSPKGRYCNLGASKHVLKVYEVIGVSNAQSVEEDRGN